MEWRATYRPYAPDELRALRPWMAERPVLSQVPHAHTPRIQPLVALSRVVLKLFVHERNHRIRRTGIRPACVGRLQGGYEQGGRTCVYDG